ncbi:MAG: type IIL restriction-modification enzyme MmeI, partial [Paludibacteraceae bacterium]
MLRETRKVAHFSDTPLPLKTYHNIHEGNALRVDWAEVLAGNQGGAVSMPHQELQGNIQGGAVSRPHPNDDTSDTMVRPGDRTSMGHCDSVVRHGDRTSMSTSVSERWTPYLEKDKKIKIVKPGHLPHWHQDNKIQFVTFRLADSLPQSKLQEWQDLKHTFEMLHPQPWDDATWELFNKQIGGSIDEWLDAGEGCCCLQYPYLRKIVEQAILFFDGKRYLVHSYVIMPNHVHVLVELLNGYKLQDIVNSWKSYSAREINQQIGTNGALWQKEYFDRLVRSQQHYDKISYYIQHNPDHLAEGTYSYYAIQGGAKGGAKGGAVSRPHPKDDTQDTMVRPGDRTSMGHCDTMVRLPNNRDNTSDRTSFGVCDTMVRPVDRTSIGTSFDTALKPLYIIGNPPFVGYSLQSAAQKEDMLNTLVDAKGKTYRQAGKIDYVSGWYYKACQMIEAQPSIKAAFVSTNSITQGEQVAGLWKPLFEQFGIHIDFAYPTFRWDSESNLKAHVHCVIVGFSKVPNKAPRLYRLDGTYKVCSNLNAYLVDGPDAFVESRNKPLCDVPQMITGNRPADGGHLIIEAEDYDDFVAKEPGALPYIKKLTGALEYINNKKRYCLWLTGISPVQLKSLPLVYERVRLCKEDRENAPDPGRRKLAATPHLFREQINPENYMIVPRVSSENRRYVPIGYLDKDTIPTDSATIIPNATLFHFGVLTSNVHMAWMRAVCGR